MKIYAFYRIRNVKNGELLSLPILEAFTSSKEYRDIFIEQREMNLFHCVEKRMDKQVYNEFMKKNKSKELAYQELYTKKEVGDKIIKTKVAVLSTWAEIEAIFLKGDIIIDELSKHVSPIIYFLKPEYRNALTTLNYLDICKFSYQDNFEFHRDLFSGFEGSSINMMKQSGWGELTSSVDIDCDEFALYMYFRSPTYK